MDLAIGVEILLFDKSGFGPHPNFHPLGVGSNTCAIRGTERNAEYSFSFTAEVKRGTRWRSWLRHCATSRKVAGSIPDGVIGIFH